MTLLLALLLVTVVCVPFVVALPLIGVLAVVPLRRTILRCDAQPLSLRAAVPSRAPPV
jgi:hypothetical protein